MMFHHNEINGLPVLAMVLGKYMESKVFSLHHVVGGSPSPDTYNPTESFKKITPIRGFKFVPPGAKKYNKHIHESNPGPGAYTLSLSLYRNSRAPTLKGRLNNYSTFFEMW